MSLKYQRVKKADESLPAPLRWLTRAFSSITLAVILLSLISLYGVMASMPLMYLLLAGVYLLIGLGTVGVCAVGLWQLNRRVGKTRALNREGEAPAEPQQPEAVSNDVTKSQHNTQVAYGSAGASPSQGMHGGLRLLLGVLALAIAGVVCVLACIEAHTWITAQLWFDRWHATVIYRLPAFEMTELEFYAWWPMQVLLALFVLNMIWSTFRRIEFNVPNIGVLTVHLGIVILSLGAMFYGYFKVEGDMILMRRDLDGQFHSTFYDVFTPAVFIQRSNGRGVMVPLPQLPRYNDYEVGELDIALHEMPGVATLLGDNVRLTIPGFMAYADLQDDFVDAKAAIQGDDRFSAEDLAAMRNVMVQLASGDRDSPDMIGNEPMQAIHLNASNPAQRVHRDDRFSVELLDNPDPQRIADLSTELDAPHVLMVRIPERNFEQVIAIEPGSTYAMGDTGYEIAVTDVGPYGIPFITQGYEGATDTRAMVKFTGDGKNFTRMVMHRYPERSQDFLTPAPGSVSENTSETPSSVSTSVGTQSTPQNHTHSAAPHAGPMAALGQRSDPDPAIEMVYLDNTKAQFHLIHRDDQPQLQLLLRLPGMAPMSAPLSEDRFIVPGQFQQHPHWLHVLKHDTHAVPTVRAVPVPQELRNPQDEGDYTNAIIPIVAEVDYTSPDGSPQTWRQMLWLKHMRYPHWADDLRRPLVFDLPGVGPVTVAFSRQQHPLPFALALEDFEMIPIPGSDVERDFVATLLIDDVHDDGTLAGNTQRVQARLNAPVIHRPAGAPLPFRAVKISQVAWDQGDLEDPGHAARDAEGRFINQQRFTILGIANNVGIRIIFIGSTLMVLGIPWAFYVKPWLLQRQKRKTQRELAA